MPHREHRLVRATKRVIAEAKHVGRLELSVELATTEKRRAAQVQKLAAKQKRLDTAEKQLANALRE